MKMTPQSQAMLLLTVNFGKSDASGAKPLSNSEWGRFAAWLRDHGMGPADLLNGDLTNLDSINDIGLSVDRIRSLTERGAALGFALEKWERAGLWVITRADPEYPERLKRRLKALSPPVLFGCGNTALLNKGGLAVVGSRNASDADIEFTQSLGRHAAAEGASIVSGGARGVDEAAMAGTLDGEGTGVAVLADSLLKSATSSRFRRPIMAGDLALISPFNPEAGFFSGNAMARNKYIYCLADAAVVVACTPDKGGTWSGAVEALKKAWVPVWVMQSAASGSGNPLLADRGARWVPDELPPIAALFDESLQKTLDDNLPLEPRGRQDAPAVEIDAQPLERPSWNSAPVRVADEVPPSERTNTAPYEAFLSALSAIKSLLPLGADQIAGQLGMKKSAASAHLKRGVNDGRIKKLSKPVRYDFVPSAAHQPSLFDNEL